MIFKRKANQIFCFDSEEELKDCCAENNNINIKMYQDFDVSKYNKRNKRFDKIKSNKI